MEHRNKLEHTREVVARLIRRRWHRPLQIAGAAGLLMMAMGFSAFRPSVTRQAAARQERRAGATALQTQGIVKSGLTKGIGAAFEGQLADLAVQPGEKVKKGQLLFRLDTSIVQTQLDAVKEQASAAAMNLQQVRANRAADLAGWAQQAASLEAELRQEREAARQWKQAAQTSYTDGITVYAMPDPAGYDGSRVAQLEAQLQTVREQMAQIRQSWEPSLREAQTLHAQASQAVKQTAGLLAAAKRTSPISGVVTGIYAQQGQVVQPGQSIVRVDDPSSYRVVVLVGEDVRDQLQPGAVVPVEAPQGRTEGKLVKIQSGWDENLFQYWVWVQPKQPETLRPEETVKLTLPTATQTAAAY